MNNLISYLSTKDLTASLALIVSMCALLSAPVTEIIKSIFSMLLKHMELKSDERKNKFNVLYEKKFQAYMAFISAAGNNRGGGSFNRQNEAVSAAHAASLLCDRKTLPLLIAFQDEMPSDPKEYAVAVSQISQSFNRELTKLSRKI